jgi:hypothetical protein
MPPRKGGFNYPPTIKVNGVQRGLSLPEHEEKPLTQPTSLSSEDYHGGEELTFSLPSQSSPQSTSDNQNTQQAQSSFSPQYNESIQQDLENESKTTSDDDNVQKPENARDTGTSVDAEREPEDESINGNESQQDSQQEFENPNESEENQVQSHVYNTQQAFEISSSPGNVRYYQTEFYRFLEMIAEEKTKLYDPANAEEYNVKKLMFRPYERKPLNHYKMSRVRDMIVLILDNSGSMRWWSENLWILAELAMQRNDIEVYIAPNGYIEEMLWPRRQRVSHSEIMKRLRERRIIYVGDFDGADTPVELSWYNDVIWVCPEERYVSFREHDWVHYDEEDFKGAFLRVFTLDEMLSAFRKLLSNPSLKAWIDMRGGEDE